MINFDKKNTKPPFRTVDDLWKKFMALTGISEGSTPPFEFKERKKTFYAACGLMFFFMVDDIPALTEEEGIKVFERIQEDLIDFWSSQLTDSSTELKEMFNRIKKEFSNNQQNPIP